MRLVIMAALVAAPSAAWAAEPQDLGGFVSQRENGVTVIRPKPSPEPARPEEQQAAAPPVVVNTWSVPPGAVLPDAAAIDPTPLGTGFDGATVRAGDLPATSPGVRSGVAPATRGTAGIIGQR